MEMTRKKVRNSKGKVTLCKKIAKNYFNHG